MIIHYFSQDEMWIKSRFKVKGSRVFVQCSIKLCDSLSLDLRAVNTQIVLDKFGGQDTKHSIPGAA